MRLARGGLDRRGLLAGGLALAAGHALAQTAASSAPATASQDLARVVMKTAKGVITLDLNVGKAPITAHNFLRYVALRRFDGSVFYRASKMEGAPDSGLIQGGLQGNPAKILKAIAFEGTIKTGLTHKDGTISMAADRPGKATADFFICLGDMSGLDADPNAPDVNPGFAAFGQVVDGMDVVRAIHAAHTSPTAGGPGMKGEMLSPPIAILSVRKVVRGEA
jgi:peptidyl-prolyl cis-trans isomerase A (cyclophilin A)